MTFKEYKERVRETAIYPNQGINHIYPCLGLIGEFGELSSNVNTGWDYEYVDQFHLAVKKEIGDCFWYIVKIYDELKEDLNLDLETVKYSFTADNHLDIGVSYIGYIAEALKKCIRDNDGILDAEKRLIILNNTSHIQNLLLSFILFMGYNLETILQMNVDKLQSRKERGVLHGSGDNR